MLILISIDILETVVLIWDEFLRHFRLCDEEDSGLSDEEQKRKRPKK